MASRPGACAGAARWRMSRCRDAVVLAAAAAASLAALASGFAQDVRPAPRPSITPPAHAVAAAKRLGIGSAATPEEIAGWDIAIRPDGKGLPPGTGTVKQGEALYMERCAACHGEFGESAGRWPILSGGAGTLASHDPVKSVGSYWPYASTLMDYIRRSMPYGNAQSLTNDELYAVTAYVLYLNDVITDQNFELNDRNFATIKLGNAANFYDDDRETAEKHFWNKNPCMRNCAPGAATIIGRARAGDVRPDPGQGATVRRR